MTRPRVLLIGASGRLGSVIQEDLADEWQILPVSRRGTAGSIECDIMSPDNRETLFQNKFDVVVNAAAMSSPFACANNPVTSWFVNTLWPYMLAEFCSGNSLPLVHFSTDLVYSGGIPPYRETSPAVPVSFYGWTKLIADTLVRKACPDALTVRTSVLCGETHSERTTFSQDILSGKIAGVFVDCWRNHTPIHWLVSLLPELMKNGEKGLVIASGRYSQSRSAYAEALLRKHGRSADHLIQEYAPPGIPAKLHLRGKYSTSSIF